MPKLLVLVAGTDADTTQVAQWVHEGARGVRFAEAEIATLPGPERPPGIERIRPLAGVDALAEYDAVALGGCADDLAALRQLLLDAESLGLRGALANKLGAVVPSADPATAGERHPLWSLLAPMARYGMLLVPPGYAGPTGVPEGLEAASRRLGKRLIDIAAWITHARSHAH